ncbi:MAG TPA: 2-phospho-L-lactate transferase CofD family protein, partial [Nitriliruptorales bacterium]
TRRLHEGASLSQVTAEVSAAFELEITLLPATDDPVETRIETTDGRDLHFQEYWVGEHAAPEVAKVRLAGADVATPAPGVLEVIAGADAVLVCPSNPVVSIGTILQVPGITSALRATEAPVVGVSPIVGGRVVRGMADRLLPAIGAETSALGVARHYADWLDGWIVDQRDARLVPAVEELGLVCRATDTMMDDVDVAVRLARTVLDLASELR